MRNAASLQQWDQLADFLGRQLAVLVVLELGAVDRFTPMMITKGALPALARPLPSPRAIGRSRRSGRRDRPGPNDRRHEAQTSSSAPSSLAPSTPGGRNSACRDCQEGNDRFDAAGSWQTPPWRDFEIFGERAVTIENHAIGFAQEQGCPPAACPHASCRQCSAHEASPGCRVTIPKGMTSPGTAEHPPRKALLPIRTNWWTAVRPPIMTLIADVAVATERRAIGEGHIVADDTIMRDVRVGN